MPEQPLDIPDRPDLPDHSELRPALEAVLMVADQPLAGAVLAATVGHPVAEVEQALTRLAAEYTAQGRGFDLRTVAGGWRFYTREQWAPVVERFVLEGQQSRLTQAALETLAVVAYRQPIARGRIAAVRGVNVDGVMRTLLTRGLVTEAGRDEPSGAHLYCTTPYFLERIGISSLDELPDIAPYLPDLHEFDPMDEAEPPQELENSRASRVLGAPGETGNSEHDQIDAAPPLGSGDNPPDQPSGGMNQNDDTVDEELA